MTIDELSMKRIKPFMEVLFCAPRFSEPQICMLLAIDFECELLRLVPFDRLHAQGEDFYAPIKMCELPRPKPKKVK